MSSTAVTLKTTGLHCRSCSMMVDMVVGELEGVESVATDHSTGDTQVQFDSDVVSVDDMIAAIRAAGYDAEKPSTDAKGPIDR